MEWKEVSPEEAVQNRYYGLGGWLLTIYALAVVGFVVRIVPLADVAFQKAQYGESYGTMMVLGVVQAFFLLPFLILAPMKNRWMPKASISAYWMTVSLWGIAGILVGLSRTVPLIIGSVIYVLLFTWYVNKSKRVNVTYLHRVPVETGPEDAV